MARSTLRPPGWLCTHSSPPPSSSEQDPESFGVSTNLFAITFFFSGCASLFLPPLVDHCAICARCLVTTTLDRHALNDRERPSSLAVLGLVIRWRVNGCEHSQSIVHSHTHFSAHAGRSCQALATSCRICFRFFPPNVASVY